MTNYHVIRGAARMVARLHDGSEHEVESILEFDTKHDIAALQIQGSGLSAVTLGDSSGVKTGDHVTVLGAPLGLESTLSDGIISAVRDVGPFVRVLQTSAPVSHGSSGGPLFDDYGKVIGLAVSTIEAGENLNFAVPIDTARPMLSRTERMSFTEMLAQTLVRQPVLTSSMVVQPQVVSTELVVPPQTGRLEGSITIAGGLGNDIGISLMAANSGVVWNPGVVVGSAELNLPLRGGRYRLIFNNKMGPFWVHPKTVSGMVELSYYR